MRPKILYPLFRPATQLPGVGPATGRLLERLAGPAVVDLLWHLPRGVVDRRPAPRLADAPEGAVATFVVAIERHAPPQGPGRPYRISCGDGSGALALVFFNGREDRLRAMLPEGAARVVSGKVERYRDGLQMVHPDRVGTLDELDAIRTVEPVYPSAGGLSAGVLRRAARGAVEAAPALPEWQDPAWLERRGWPGWRDALRSAHAPSSPLELDPGAPARERLAYDELLANQLAVLIVRGRRGGRPARPLRGDGSLRRRLAGRLPFALTSSQEQAAAEIAADMASGRRMLRMLQGDVGSGKTVVALLAMLVAAEEGRQAALLAPTALLARQHHATVASLLDGLGVASVLVAGGDAGRVPARAELASGEALIAVGTHALLQDGVAFRDLALCVVDEQHRFGVRQRLALSGKGAAPHLLATTATPIPRTLMMTAYGDLECTRMAGRPPGRRPAETRAAPLSRLGEVVERLAAAVADGAKAYWICPLVDESEAADLAAATARHAALSRRLGGRVGLAHGRQRPAVREDAMARFAAGEVDVLVATTVVEVGVDVPGATIMVVEHAERFGLAQLHQLRGRVGRGGGRSSCLLLCGDRPSRAARGRIAALRETDDGFVVAEKDLELRGAGEALGARQSGPPRFRLADLGAHADLAAAAREDAKQVLGRDPDLATERGEALRVLLHLFERDAVVRTALSG